MSTKHWVGTLRGSRVGPLYWIEHNASNGDFSFTTTDNKAFAFRSIRDQESDGLIALVSEKPDEKGNPVRLGELRIEAANEDICNGTWHLADGSRGIFDLQRRSFSTDIANVVSQGGSPKLWNKEIPLGAITLYRRDLDSLIAELETHIPDNASTVIRATESGQVIVQNVNDYLSRRDLLDVVSEFTISRESNDTPGFKKIITVNLNNNGENNVVASSPDELWTSAVSQRVASFMEQFTSSLTGFLRRHGLNVNSFLIIGLVIVLPDYHVKERIIITIGVIFIILMIARSHKFIRFARVYLDHDRTKRPFSKELPSAILAVAATGIAATFGALPEIVDFVQNSIRLLL